MLNHCLSSNISLFGVQMWRNFGNYNGKTWRHLRLYDVTSQTVIYRVINHSFLFFLYIGMCPRYVRISFWSVSFILYTNAIVVLCSFLNKICLNQRLVSLKQSTLIRIQTHTFHQSFINALKYTKCIHKINMKIRVPPWHDQ